MINARKVNHIEHHKTQSSRTLMRRSINVSNQPESLKIKTQTAFQYNKTTKVLPLRHVSIKAERHERAAGTERSQYLSHFTRLSGSSFTPTAHPIKSVVHKPKLENELSIDELLLKAVDNIEDQLLNLEQQPARRLHRFARSFVANRFNGVALD